MLVFLLVEGVVDPGIPLIPGKKLSPEVAANRGGPKNRRKTHIRMFKSYLKMKLESEKSWG